MILDYEKAKEKLLNSFDLSCQQFFVQNGYILESAYSELLSDEIEQAKTLANQIKDENMRAHWLIFMISLIEGNVKEYPTYLEIRNFLEIDLNILIKNFKGNYVENIIRYSDFLFTINPEVFKFIGRVFYNNDLKEQALFFLERAKCYFYNDPELHFLIAYIFYNDKNFMKAKISAKECLRILPYYFPARNLLSKMN